MSRPQDVFADGHRVPLADGEARVLLRELGRVKVTSGKLGACDPFVGARDTKPFARIVPEGAYPVDVCVLEMPNGDRRVGFARLRLAATAPASWENAALEGRRLNELQPGHSYGYGVDAGTGCFADIVALRAFDECGEDASGELLQALERTYEHTWSWADITCGDANENVIAFSSGLGDGFYSSFWGLAPDGEAVCLATDFGVCDVDWAIDR